MTRTIRLHEINKYFPSRPFSPIQSITSFPPIHLGKDLENRLITFALGLGATSARIDLSGTAPALVVISSRGKEIRTDLTSTARDWHLALNEFEELYDENEVAGLYRFLRVPRRIPEVRKPASNIGADNRCFDHLQRMAA